MYCECRYTTLFTRYSLVHIAIAKRKQMSYYYIDQLLNTDTNTTNTYTALVPHKSKTGENK